MYFSLPEFVTGFPAVWLAPSALQLVPAGRLASAPSSQSQPGEQSAKHFNYISETNNPVWKWHRHQHPCTLSCRLRSALWPERCWAGPPSPPCHWDLRRCLWAQWRRWMSTGWCPAPWSWGRPTGPRSSQVSLCWFVFPLRPEQTKTSSENITEDDVGCLSFFVLLVFPLSPCNKGRSALLGDGRKTSLNWFDRCGWRWQVRVRETESQKGK